MNEGVPQRLAGLGEEEARRRLADEGPNALPAARGQGILALAWRVATEPMFVLLIGAGGRHCGLK